MKIASMKFVAAVLFSAITILPLWAQTNEPGGTGTNNAAPPPSVSIDRTGLHIVGEASYGEPREARLSTSILIQNLVAILSFFGTIIAVVGVIAYARNRKKNMLHETLRAMIEKGAPIPTELIAKPNRARRPGGDLRWGLVLTALGIGVMAIAGKIGLIFLLVGVAFLIVWMVEKKNRNNEPSGK